jgi:hypothetical protein
MQAATGVLRSSFVVRESGKAGPARSFHDDVTLPSDSFSVALRRSRHNVDSYFVS